jgi:hypothetical protein
MGLESATFIENLDANNPLANDAISQADDHLRLIKSVLKSSFPNINAAVTAIPAELNKKTAIVSDGAGQLTFNTNVTQALLQTLLGIIKPALSIDGSTLSIDSGTTASAIKTQLGITDTTALDAYPVGSVYISVLATDPATHFGGGSQWTRIAEGRMLVGQQTNDSDFATAEQDGGSKTVTLSTDNLPAHTHDILSATATDVEVIGSSETNIREIRDSSVRSATTTDATESTGSGTAFNNMNPYFVVYMWKRTA